MTLDKHRVPGSVDKHLPDIRASDLRSESVNVTFVYIGAGGAYPDVNSAVSDLSPSGGQRYRLVLLEDTDEPSQTTWKNRIDLDTNGYEMVLSSGNAEHTILVPDGVSDAYIGQYGGAIVREGEPSGNAHVLQTEGDAAPTVGVDVLNRVPQTAADNNYHGVQSLNSSAPVIEGDAVGGDGGDFCRGVLSFDSSAPVIEGGSIRGGGAKVYKRFFSSTGTDSFVPEANHPTFVNSLQLSVTTAGSAGATIDIGTTVGGGEIASGIPADSTGDKSVAISHAELAAGDSIHVTPTESGIAYNIDYTIRRNYSGCEALYNASVGAVELHNVDAWSNRASDCAYIGSDPNTAKDYLIAGGSFVTADPSGQNALVGASDNGQTDPIYNVAAVGGIVNLTTQ